MTTAMAYTTRGVTSEDRVTSAGDAMSSSPVDSNTDYPPPLHCPPSRLTATKCVFDLIAKTTPVLIVKHEPIVNGTVVRRREALRWCYTTSVLFAFVQAVWIINNVDLLHRLFSDFCGLKIHQTGIDFRFHQAYLVCLLRFRKPLKWKGFWKRTTGSK